MMGSTRRFSIFAPARRLSRATGSTSSEFKSQQSESLCPDFWSQTPPDVQPCHYGYDYDDDHVDPAGDSIVTYASTEESEFEDEDDEPPVEVARKRRETHPAKTVATTPPTFASLFPSTRRLLIQHDDSADGNMNLRIDTLIPKRGEDDIRAILFHLRMHDLYRRKFSLRRYCRSSGREVCQTERIEVAPEKAGPYGQKDGRRFSLALRGLHGKGENDTLRRYASAPQRLNDKRPLSGNSSSGSVSNDRRRPMTDTIKLEFSNYAHVQITRRGRDSSVHYDFEYWGLKYQWRKITIRRRNGRDDAAYCLYPIRRSSNIARISFTALTTRELHEEERKGSWVLPCSIRICDSSVYQKGDDLADVIIATGLMALVDDCIRHHWPQESPNCSSSSMTNTVAKALDKVFHPHRRHFKPSYGDGLRRFASHG